MGLDIYAGSVTRYVAGDWLTIVQQVGQATGLDVRMIRMNEPPDAVRDAHVVHEAVIAWQTRLLKALGAAEAWEEAFDADYSTDKPDWDGYGAVILLAAYDERPDLAPGTGQRTGPRRQAIAETAPRQFGEAAAYQAAWQSPQRYPTLLSGAEWCLPLSTGPAVFQAPMPNGKPITMGRVDSLLTELETLNARTLNLSGADLAAASEAGPPDSRTTVAQTAPFGLAVLLRLASYAATRRTAWIMDY